MRRTATIILFLVGALFPAFSTRIEAAPLSGVEQDILAGFTDADIENLRRVMDNDLWRSIVQNWHRKSPAQKSELQARLQEFAAQPNPEEWSQQNRPSVAPLLKSGAGGLIAGGLAAAVPLTVSLFRNLSAAHVIAGGGTATVSKFFSTFFKPVLVSQVPGQTVTRVAFQWGRIAPVIAIGAVVGAAAIYGITKLVQNYRHGKSESTYNTERERLRSRLSDIATATSPQAPSNPGDQPPMGTVGPGSAPVVAAPIGGAPGIEGDDVRVTDRP